MYEVTLDEHEAQPILALSDRISREQVADFLQQAYPRLFAALQGSGAAPAGPPLARYRIEGDTFQVTAGLPFRGEPTLPEGVGVDALPAGPVAATVHHGSYESLPEAFHAVVEWIAAQGYRIAGDPWESYLDGPEVAEPRTKVCFPVTR